MQTLFWLCLLLVLYHGLGYPLIVKAWAAHLRRSRPAQPQGEDAALPPSVTIIVPAYNEERYIADKIANLAELDYPRDKLRVVVALDGCVDQTALRAEEAMRRWNSDGVMSLKVFDRNRGKIAVVNELVEGADSDIVALTDVSAMLSGDSLRKLVRHFQDASVGVVCPAYGLSGDATEGDRAYWDYQIAIKDAEGVIAGPIGPHGAFYMFRRALWRPLRPDTINDDFVMPMRMVEAGARAVYDRSIVALEVEPTPSSRDFRRRMRLGAGNLQQVLLLPGLANPARGALTFLFLSGKALRALTPLLLAIAFVASIGAALQGSVLFWLIVAGEMLLLAVVAGVELIGPERAPKPAMLAAYAIRGWVASALGCLFFLFGAGRKVWNVSNAPKQGGRV